MDRYFFIIDTGVYLILAFENSGQLTTFQSRYATLMQMAIDATVEEREFVT
jgi:hypothetical protein